MKKEEGENKRKIERSAGKEEMVVMLLTFDATFPGHNPPLKVVGLLLFYILWLTFSLVFPLEPMALAFCFPI